MKHYPKGLQVFALLCGMIAFMVPCAWAQIYSGSITGLVTDPSGAVVPGAKVVVTDIGKQVPQTLTTDSTGRYLIRSLPPSTYKLSVEMQGFNMYVQDNIMLEVNQNLAIDVVLKLGAETQTVEVQAAASTLATQDATTGQELNRTFINDLPLLGRSVFDLATLAPGVHRRDGGGTEPINFISNGSRNETSDILLDGVSATSFEQNSGILDPLYIPSVDSVQEFKIQQSNFSAEIGFSGATVINMVTRSGNNAFHGSAWEFLRNNVLTANNWFNNASGTPLAPRRYNLFGGTVGGPLKKDKTFFFFSYEGTRDINAGTYTAGVPSAAMRKGDFGEICAEGFDSSGKCLGDGQLWDPYSGVYDSDLSGDVRSRFIPYNNLATYVSPGNPKLAGTSLQPPAKPGNLIDPAAYNIMQYFPLPNVKVGQAGYDIYNNWLGSGSNKNNNDQFDIKIDHSFNDNNRISAKYSHAKNSSNPATPFGNDLDPTNNIGTSDANLFALNYTRTFSPNTLLNL
ncbi:MAG TPA: carboxypeptidase-like regulatory domain-containing protein, partial [Terriglobia bacterium]|nr:carboxypeptidase-like regulatory domain-containing protein [Terriglobia bacterium]